MLWYIPPGLLMYQSTATALSSKMGGGKVGSQFVQKQSEGVPKGCLCFEHPLTVSYATCDWC